jgi:hypothetical protein
MSEAMNIVSAWTRQVATGQQPSSTDLRDHLAAVHDNNAGFTEALAWNCRDANEKIAMNCSLILLTQNAILAFLI